MNNELDVNDWISSAQGDLDNVALASQIPLIAITCYHCGQAVEKILKAYSIAMGDPLKKMHDLTLIIKKCEEHSPDFGKFKDICMDISTYSTIRYPPERNVAEQEMRQAIKDAHEIVDFTREKLKQLGYNPPPKPPSEILKKMIDAAEAVKKHTYTKTPN